MTESNQGPATPGTAARCDLGGACVWGPSIVEGHEVCCLCLRLRAAPSEVPEIERLKAENASLREAAGNGCGVCHCRALAEAQKELDAARATEAELRHLVDVNGDHWRAAEQRNTALKRALRKFGWHVEPCATFPGRVPGPCDCGFDAALHDEERRPGEEK